MKKLSSLMILVLVIAMLPMMVAAQETPANRGLTNASPAGGPAVPAASPNPEAVLWDQPLLNYDAYANQDFESAYDGYDMFTADDFVNAVPWTISSIFVPGLTWNLGGDLTCANTLNWQIYADDGGVPDGDPWTGGAEWSISLAPSDPQVILSANGADGYLTDVTVNLATPLDLPAGTWWLVFVPQLDFDTCFQYGRHVSGTTNGYVGQVINPGGGFGFPMVWTSIQDPATWELTEQDLAFTLQGEAVPVSTLTCGDITAVPRLDPFGRYILKWLVEAVDEGGTPVGDVAVTADLTFPDYSGRVVTRTRYTHSNGFARFHWGTFMSGTWTIDVSDMVLEGYAFVDGPQCTGDYTNP